MADPIAPPHDLDAEMSVLGSILLEPDALFKIADWLTPEDFYRASNGSIYKAALTLAQKGIPIDQVTVANEMGQAKVDLIGGRAVLANLTRNVPTARNIVHYATIVREKANLWRLRRASEATLADIAKGETEFVDVLTKAQEAVFAIARDRIKSGAVSVGELLEHEWDRLTKLAESGAGIIGVPTGYVDLDRMIGGLEDDDLIIFAGRPSMGKTALAQNIAVNFALAGRGVLFFSLEMSKEQLMERLLALVAGVDAQRLHRGILNEAEMARISQASGPIHSAPLYIDDDPSLDELMLLTKARKESVQHSIQLVIVDYLQLMEGTAGTRENRTQEVSGISRALKRLARQLGVPVIAISQLSRKVEERPDKKPMLSDLRESGQIEADADIVLLLWREDYYREVSTKKQNICEINVAKQRRGPTGTISLHFNRSLTKFADLSDRGEYE